MTRRFKKPPGLEFKLPLSLLESCWLISGNSEVCLTALTSDSVRLNIFLEKSKDHARFLFKAIDDIPFFKTQSGDLWKCEIESFVELGASMEILNNETSRQLPEETRKRKPKSKTLQKRYCGDDAPENVTTPLLSCAKLEGEIYVESEPEEKTRNQSVTNICSTTSLDDFKSRVVDVTFPVDASPNVENKGNVGAESLSVIKKKRKNDDDSDSSNCLASTHIEYMTSQDQVKLRKYKSTGCLTRKLKAESLRKLTKTFSKQGICPHCNIYYGNLSQHIMTYCQKNPERQRAFHCCYCKFKSLSKEELAKHKTTHILLRDFKCELCDSGFFTRQRLLRHMRYVHLVGNNPVKIYTCEVCDKRFRYRSHFDRHLTIHQEEKSVQCEMCGKFFKNKHNVHNHQSRMHQVKTFESFPFYCEKCGQGFLHLGSHQCSSPQRPCIRNTSFDAVRPDQNHHRHHHQKQLIEIC